MGLRVIDGGLSAGPSRHVDAEQSDASPSREDLKHEADRRLEAAGYQSWRNRQILTGIPIPREIAYLAMQIGFVAEALGRLAAIPADFRSDVYWPRGAP